MSLRQQIHLIVAGLTLLFLGAVLALQVRSLHESVHEEVVTANRVAAQLLNRTAWRYAQQGTPMMEAFLRGLGRVRSNDIFLFDGQGNERYRSPPSPYKAGREAPAWFAAWMSPPVLTQTIDFPDGRLAVQANASRAVLDAWDELGWLLVGSLLLLVLLNVLVYAWVGRTVRPFAAIVGALGEVEAGRFNATLPPLRGREAAAIGAAFNRMAGQLQQQLETERRALRAETQLSDSRELTRWIDHHIERERRLIARELHDELGQSVTAMRSMALSVAQRLQTQDAASSATAQLIADEALRLYDAMHGIIPRLTPLVLDNFGLGAALGDLVERTRRSQPGLAIRVQVDLGDANLSADAALALYRAAQEGITNALRHGAATALLLEVHADAQQVRLQLQDNGCGLPTGSLLRSGHYGLRWLDERVQALHGTLQLDAAKPQGAVLRVRLPLRAAEAVAA